MIRRRMRSPRRRRGGRPRLLPAVAALVAALAVAGCTTTVASTVGSSAARPGVEVSPSALALQQQFVRVVTQVGPSVVLIQTSQGLGSGIVFDAGGNVVTNAHVVQGASKVTVSFEENGQPIDAQVKGIDADSDLAVLKVDPSKVKNLTVLPLGDSSKLEVGDPVVAIGNPFGLQRTVTTGIVSALQRQLDAPNGFQISHVIQTDASINPGNSGGPLLNAQGQVIGINSQIATGGGQGSVGIGFAIPIDTAKDLLPKLRQGEDIKRAYLGVEMSDMTSGIASDLNLPVDHGALIQSVQKGSPAGDAGLRAGKAALSNGGTAGGDVIVAVDGKEMKSANDVVQAVAHKKPGDKVRIDYYRDNKRESTTVTLGERPAQLNSPSSDQQQAPNQGFNLP
jgi:S1-C subfamily serine protease